MSDMIIIAGRGFETLQENGRCAELLLRVHETLVSETDDVASLAERFDAAIGAIASEHGADAALKVMSFMLDSGFLAAPASTRFHLAYAGGLLEHSLNVFEWMVRLTEGADIATVGQCATIGLLHDLCKADSYVFSDEKQRFVWNADARLEDVADADEHGELSAKRARRLIASLTEDEADAIEWHMGLYDHRIYLPHGDVSAEQLAACKEGRRAYDAASKRTPLVKIAHIADMSATNISELGK